MKTKQENNLEEIRIMDRLMSIDEKLYAKALPMESFEYEEGIYRIDYDNYLSEKDFNEAFENERERLEYFYVFNSFSPTKAIREMINLTDLELSALVEEQLEHEECYVYFTTSEWDGHESDFQKGDIAIYRNGETYSLVEIKEVLPQGKYRVYSHTGDTSAVTHERNLLELQNEYAFLILRRKADTSVIQETKARVLANKIIEKFEEITEKDFEGEDYYKLEDEITELINNYKGE